MITKIIHVHNQGACGLGRVLDGVYFTPFTLDTKPSAIH